jgi:CheY-like chemotaxis protein
MVSAPLPVLIVGPHERIEFRNPAAFLIERGAIVVRDIAGALTTIQSGYSPTVIVILQAWPGQYQSTDFNKLRATCPLARMVRLLGTWMEGELRSGLGIPGALRTYWHEAAGRFAQEVDHFAMGIITAWAFPVTANEQDRLLGSWQVVAIDTPTSKAEHPNTFAKSIAIYAEHRETAEGLADVCSQCGWRGIWLSEFQDFSPAKFDALWIDSTRGAPGALAAMRLLNSLASSTPTIALVGFAREDEIQQLHAAGASVILRKPFVVADLEWEMNRLFGRVQPR